MTNPISNHPRGARGAFVEYSKGLPGLVLPFQFNPVQLQRSRSLSFGAPGQAKTKQPNTLQALHQREKDPDKLRDGQQVQVQEESISLEIRLDATDRLNEGDQVAALLGVGPQLAILEQMVCPTDKSLLSKIREKIASSAKHFSYTKSPNPPLVLFTWGARWVLPVNINSLTITESEFNTKLYPIRVTATVQLTVIEGANALYTASLRAREALAVGASALNVVDMVIPG